MNKHASLESDQQKMLTSAGTCHFRKRVDELTETYASCESMNSKIMSKKKFYSCLAICQITHYLKCSLKNDENHDVSFSFRYKDACVLFHLVNCPAYCLANSM